MSTQFIGTLIGAYSSSEAADVEAAWTVISNAGAIRIGSSYDGTVPKDGYLYLIFNDIPAFIDNVGAVSVEITTNGLANALMKQRLANTQLPAGSTVRR